MQQEITILSAYENIYDSYDSSYDYIVYENDFAFSNENEEDLSETESGISIEELPTDYPEIESSLH